MERKSRKIIVISIILIFLVSTIPFKNISNKSKSSDEINVEKSVINEEINEEPESIEKPKTAGNPGQSYNLTINTTIYETWNRTWDHGFCHSFRGGQNPGDYDWLIQWDTTGYSVFYEFNITNLVNYSEAGFPNIKPSDLTNLALEQYNGSFDQWVFVANINDGIAIGDGYCSGFISMNWSVPGVFRVTYTYLGKTNVTYNAMMKFWRIPNQSEVKTEFIPDTENTQTDYITWEISYENYLPGYILGYQANLTIENFTEFTIRDVKGLNSGYWELIHYETYGDGIVINESAEVFIIELQTNNYVSVMYNDNLSFSYNYQNNQNELRLHVTCKMTGNLTIRFKDTDGHIYEDIKDQPVKKDKQEYYNYIMPYNATGGIGSLNITLLNNSKIFFGIKILDIEFHKQAVIIAFTNNTYAFNPEFYVGAFYIDFDKFFELIWVKKLYDLNTQFLEVLNLTMIPNATLTYELDEYSGIISYGPHPDPGLGSKVMLYFKQIDLRELLLLPGEYNITFKASKPCYNTHTNVTEIEIWKRPVDILINPTKTKYQIEENFTIIIDLSVEYPETHEYYPTENYLRVLSNLNITFINNDTGKIEVGPLTWWESIIQSIDISDTIGNDTLPGLYILNVTLISDYYEGVGSSYLEILKNSISISLLYDDDDLEEDEEFEILWQLSGGGSKNRENMSVEVFIDGFPHATYYLKNYFSGTTKLELDEGEYYVTYRLISPFYTAETTVKLEIKGKEEPEPTWLEENWLWVLIGIIAIIAMAAIAVFLLISRHKVKAQRALDSELVALKTKTTASEQKISLIEAQISEIASIYWILVIHSEQGVPMIEIVDFKFENVLDEEHKLLIGKGMIRDSALIGGFLTAIRNFSRETSDTSLEYQPVFNSQTDYSTVVDDNEIHRRILEGTDYFMAIISSRGTIEISDVLSSVNSIFQEEYSEVVKNFDGSISPFTPFEDQLKQFLYDEIRELQKKLKEEQLILRQFEGHLKEVQEKIGIKPKKLN